MRLRQELIDNPDATVVAGKENPNILYGINEAGTNKELLEALERNPTKSAWDTVFNYAAQQAKSKV